MCLGCGLGRRDPLPADEDLFVYYSQNYRVEIGKGRKPTKRRLWRIAEGAVGRCNDVLARCVGVSLAPPPRDARLWLWGQRTGVSAVAGWVRQPWL